MQTDLERAKAELRAGDWSLVLVKEGRVAARTSGPGLRELLALAGSLGDTARGASLADRVVGRAAALVALAMGIRAVYTPLLSEGGRRVLEESAIDLVYERVVPMILNRSGEGQCPMERLVEGMRDPHEALSALRAWKPPAPV